ncbi:Phage tail protein [Vibrio crassostreae]|nr:Phage tail protein [Vibrio crassostreae]
MSIEQKITDLQRTSAEQTAASQALSQEVAGKMGEIDQKVVEAKDSFDRWRDDVQAKDINGQSVYKSVIDLTGLSTDHFYPVWWRMPDNEEGCSRITISRGSSEDRNLAPFGQGAFIAGLNLQIEGVGSFWSGDANYLTIKRFSQTYRKTVRAVQFGMKCIARPISNVKPLYAGYESGQVVAHSWRSGCYLRGGLTYHVRKSFDGQLWYSREDGEVSAGIFSPANYEIEWKVKAYHIDDPFLGSDYEEHRLAYTLDYDKRYARKD